MSGQLERQEKRDFMDPLFLLIGGFDDWNFIASPKRFTIRYTL